MKQIMIFCFCILNILHSFGQVKNKIEEQIIGAWDFSSFELNPNKTSYIGVKPEVLVYLLFTEDFIFLRGNCNVNNNSDFRIDNCGYSIKKNEEGGLLDVKIKKSDLLKTCGNVAHIEIISCNDSILKIKSFINDGNVIYKRMPTPSEVAIQVYPLLQGHWVYKNSYSGSPLYGQSVANPRDSIVSYHFKADSVTISFSNNKFPTINSSYSIIVEPWFNAITIKIEGVEEKYCIEIPRLFIKGLKDISNSHFIIHLCGTDSDCVEFIKVK